MHKVLFEIQAPTDPDNATIVHMEDEQDFNRVYVRIDNKFDISIKRTEEGVIVDIYAGHDFQDLMDSAQALDDDILNPEEMECGSSTETAGNTAPGIATKKPSPE